MFGRPPQSTSSNKPRQPDSQTRQASVDRWSSEPKVLGKKRVSDWHMRASTEGRAGRLKIATSPDDNPSAWGTCISPILHLPRVRTRTITPTDLTFPRWCDSPIFTESIFKLCCRGGSCRKTLLCNCTSELFLPSEVCPSSIVACCFSVSYPLQRPDPTTNLHSLRAAKVFKVSSTRSEKELRSSAYR